MMATLRDFGLDFHHVPLLCGSHSGPRALAAKVIRQGFYWPAIICTANRVTRSCKACQKFSPRSGSPLQFTKLIAHTWPLQRWGLDIVGPLPTAQGNLKFTFVAVEYFTKWIEARAVSTVTSKTAQKFFWQNIVCRFGVPSELTVDNGKQFDSQDFRDFCFFIGTKPVFASVYHPQSNSVVERANGKIFSAIKKRLLDDKKGKWADQLPEVVWALNTTESQATGFTPFRLLYGSEVMTPQELKHGSPPNKQISRPRCRRTNFQRSHRRRSRPRPAGPRQISSSNQGLARQHRCPKRIQRRGPRTRKNHPDRVTGQARAEVGRSIHS
jgi:hypothetical protein